VRERARARKRLSTDITTSDLTTSHHNGTQAVDEEELPCPCRGHEESIHIVNTHTMDVHAQ
jgi:hypothetical protein